LDEKNVYNSTMTKKPVHPALAKKKAGKDWRRLLNKKTIGFLVWLLISILVYFIGTGMLEGRLNEQLSQGLGQATGGVITETRVGISFWSLPDYLGAAGRLLETLRHPGRPVLEEITLENPSFRLVPLGRGTWRLEGTLRGFSAKSGTSTVLMTRTRIEGGQIGIAPDSNHALLFTDFNVEAGPDPASPQSRLLYTLRADGPEVHLSIDGQVTQEPGRGTGINNGIQFSGIPLLALNPFFDRNLSQYIVGGDLSGEGQIIWRNEVLELDLLLSAEDLEIQTGGIRNARFRQVLETLQREGGFENRRIQAQLPMNDPAMDKEQMLMGLLGQLAR
jgi:hypothetical protein